MGMFQPVPARTCECWLSYPTIGEESLRSPRTCIRSIKNLVQAGIIEVVGKHSSGANRYRLTLDASAAVPEGHSSREALTESHSDSVGLSSSPAPACHATVSDSHRLRDTLAHEVVPEVVKEVVNGNSALTTTGQGSEGQTISANGPAESRAKNEGTDIQSTHPGLHVASSVTTSAEKTEIPDTPEGMLARQYFKLLGNPHVHREAVRLKWPALFRSLLNKYPLDVLSSAIQWAFDIDSFWPQHLHRLTGDPVEYFASKVDRILAGWRSQDAAQRNAARATVIDKGSGSSKKPSWTKLFVIE
jgi:hypothetical protein